MRRKKIYIEEDIREEYRLLTEFLIEREWTITTMESVTGGQIASLITDTEGSSAIFKGAFVTYCNEAKIMQGVPEEIIKRYGVYSQRTALAMAEACKKAYDADISIGVSGTTGKLDPENPENSEPGQVYYAFIFRDYAWSYNAEMWPQPTRLAYKLAVAKEIFDALVTELCIG